MLPQFDPTWYPSQVFWLLLTFGPFLLIVWSVILPSIRSIIDARSSQMQKDIRKAEDCKNKAEELFKEIEETQSSLGDKIKAIKTQAQTETDEFTSKLQEDYSKQRAALLLQTEEELEKEKSIALQEIAPLSKKLIKEMALKICNVTLEDEEIDALFLDGREGENA